MEDENIRTRSPSFIHNFKVQETLTTKGLFITHITVKHDQK